MAAHPAKVEELRFNIEQARKILIEAKGLRLDAATFQELIEDAEAKVEVAMDDGVRGTIVADLDRAMGKILALMQLPRAEVMAAVTVINQSAIDIDVVVATASQALIDAEADPDPDKILVAVTAQEVILREQKERIERPQDQIRHLSPVVEGSGARLNIAEAQANAKEALAKITAARRTLSLCKTAAKAQKEAAAAPGRVAAAANPADRIRIANEQSALLLDQPENIRTDRGLIPNPLPAGLEGLVDTANRIADLAEEQLRAVEPIIALSHAAAEAQQALTTARKAIVEANPEQIPVVVAAQQEILRLQAEQIVEVRGRIPDHLLAGLPADLATGATEAAAVVAGELAEAQLLAEQQIVAAERIRNLRNTIVLSGQAVFDAQNAIRDANSTDAVEYAVALHLDPDRTRYLQVGPIDAALAAIGALPLGLHPDLPKFVADVTAEAQRVRGDVLRVQGELVAARAAVAAVIELGDIKYAANGLVQDSRDALEAVDPNDHRRIVEVARDEQHQLAERYDRTERQLRIIGATAGRVFDDARQAAENAQNTLIARQREIAVVQEAAANGLVAAIDAERVTAEGQIQGLAEELRNARVGANSVGRINEIGAALEERIRRINGAIAAAQGLRNSDADDVVTRRDEAARVAGEAIAKITAALPVIERNRIVMEVQQVVSMADQAIQAALRDGEDVLAVADAQRKALNTEAEHIPADLGPIADLPAALIDDANRIAQSTKYDVLTGHLYLAVVATRATTVIAQRKLENVVYGGTMQEVSGVIDVQIASLERQKTELESARQAAVNVPEIGWDIDALREQATRAETERATKVKQLSKVKTLAEAISKVDATRDEADRELEQARREDRPSLEIIGIIDAQREKLKALQDEITEALKAVEAVGGIEQIRGQAEGYIKVLTKDLQYLNEERKEEEGKVIEGFNQKIDDIHALVDDNVGIAIAALQNIQNAKEELVKARIFNAPEARIKLLKKKIERLEKDFNITQAAKKAEIGDAARELDGEITNAKRAIGNMFSAAQLYLSAVLAELEAGAAFDKISAEIRYHLDRTAKLRGTIARVGERVKVLTGQASRTDDEKLELAQLSYRLQTCFDILAESEKELERLEAARQPAFQEVLDIYKQEKSDREAVGFGTDEIEGKIQSITDINLNREINLVLLKDHNARVRDEFATPLLYAQKAVEPPVVLPANEPLPSDKSRTPIDGAFKNWRAEANLKDAKAAIKAFTDNEEVVQPLIQAVLDARLKDDKTAEAEAVRKLHMSNDDTRNFNWLEHRKKLYDNAKAAIETLNKRMADLGTLAADKHFKAEVIAVKHEWSMADKKMRATDMSNEIVLYASKLKKSLDEIDKQFKELATLKVKATITPKPDGIDTDISVAQANLKRLSADAQLNAQKLVDLQSARRKLQEEIKLEAKKVEKDLTDLGLASSDPKITAAKDQAAAAENALAKAFTTDADVTALANVLIQDDEVTALVNKWNALRVAYGTEELPTAADQLSREGKTLAERRIWAQVELFNLLDFAVEDIVRDPKLFARYTEAMAILHPSLKLEQTKEHVKEQIGKALENDTELAMLMEAGGETQLKHWRAGEPREFKTKESKKYNAWKEELQNWQIEKIANSRFISNTTIPLTVVGIENSNNHTVSFFVAEADFYDVTTEGDNDDSGVVRIEGDTESLNTKYFSSPADTDGTVLPIVFSHSYDWLNDEKKAEILRAIPRKCTSMKPLLTYVKAQAALLADPDPDKRESAKKNIVEALQSAKADPRYAMSRVASSVAKEVALGLKAAGIDASDSIHRELQKEIEDARQKDPRVAMEDSSVTADIPFEAVRRRMIAQMIRDNPASTQEEKIHAARVIAVYDEGRSFTASDDLAAAEALDKRGFKPTDTVKIPNADGGEEVYKVTAADDDSIKLTLKKMDDRGHTSTVATITFERLGTEQTMAKISAKPSAGPAAAALAAERITAPLPAGNKTITFQLKDYDHGLFDVGGKKGAKREAEYIAAILTKDIVPVFKQHETSHHDSAIWATFKDLAIAANKKYTDGTTRDKYLEAVFSTQNSKLKTEFISGMFTKTGTLGPDKKMRICDDKKKPYTQAEFEQLPKGDQIRIIMAQAIKPQDVLDNDKEFLKKVTTVQSEEVGMGQRPSN